MLQNLLKLLRDEDQGAGGGEPNPPEPPKPNPYIESMEKFKEMLKKNKELEEENKQLKDFQKETYDKILNENEIEKEGEGENFRTYEEISKDLVTDIDSKTNLKVAELTVELVDAAEREGKQNPLLPKSELESPSFEERERAKATYELFKYGIEEAKGDSETFERIIAHETK